MVIIGDNSKLSDYYTLPHNVQDEMKVKYGPDMFFWAYPVILNHGYAVAVDENGNVNAVLLHKYSTYQHSYRYEGGVDMCFLDRYDCIFLYDCNEFSVELCRRALCRWKGKRLVLVGENWEKMIPYLPDIDNVECFYNSQFSDKEYMEFTDGMKCLSIIHGIPHAEKMDRYEQGVMYYDEVMSFTFMFSDYRQCGELNPDKKFFVVDGEYSGLGLFAIFAKAVNCARYAKSKGFIPVIRLDNSKGSFYHNDGDTEDIWQKFYNQPEEYSVSEVMKSRNVYFSPSFYNGTIQERLMDMQSEDTELSWPCGIYNDRVEKYIKEKEKIFLPYPDNTLGVLARGTDYVNTHLKNHAVHAPKEMICDKIDECMHKWDDLKYIYVATEDAEYCKYFKERYKDKVFFTDQERYTVKEGETLSKVHLDNKNSRDGFLMGVEYILSIHLLSKCNSLIASGGCGGLGEAMKQNDGCYSHVFVFSLGTN